LFLTAISKKYTRQETGSASVDSVCVRPKSPADLRTRTDAAAVRASATTGAAAADVTSPVKHACQQGQLDAQLFVDDLTLTNAPQPCSLSAILNRLTLS